MMLDYRNIRQRIEQLVRQGGRIERPYGMTDLRNRQSSVLAADSELAVAELLGHRLCVWKGLTLRPHPVGKEDVDVRLLDQGREFSVQVKTFDLLDSKYGRRISQHSAHWMSALPPMRTAISHG
jgi:tRNA U54 and U55 pseudouridine synthase Pus10